MADIYLLYILGCVVSLLLYKWGRLAAVAGFGISALASAGGAFYFLIHLTIKEVLQVPLLLITAKFTLDPVSAFFSFVICLVAIAASIYGIQYSKEYEKSGNVGVMAFFLNLFILSMLLVVSASNVFWFMVFWELMTAASYFLICFNESPKSMKSTVIYMSIAHIGGAVILIAFFLLSLKAGSFDFASFANLQLSPVYAAIVFLLAFFGFGSKAGMFPLHVWLPLAHPSAPSNVSALMSGVMLKVAIYGIVRFCMWLPVTEWQGILILVIGALSSLFGVLYALMQHDYKALLAYHSVENIGIILLGIGTGVYGIATHNMLLATVGLLGGLYHVLNHATFKGLLFLGAGSVLYRVHTKDMEILGGLARKMPFTAFAFLVGSMAISALPPFNGFVSEWFTYQSMIKAAAESSVFGKLIFPVAIIALALTGALAVMCFVKVYSVIFSGVPRKMEIWEHAKEAPGTMIAGMYILVVGCIFFGLGAPYVAKKIISVTAHITSTLYPVADSIAVYSPLKAAGISPVVITIILASMIFIPFIMIAIYKDSLVSMIRTTAPWACGAKYSPRMQMTAAPFTGSLRIVMNWLYRSDVHFEETNGYFGPVKYHVHARDIFWDIIYKPIISLISCISEKISILQNGSMQFYALYVLIAFMVFLFFAMNT
jgi:hydrogenase-4 component B